MTLKREQKNSVITLINEAGLILSDFKWEDMGFAKDRIVYKEAEFYFNIALTHQHDFTVSFTPGGERMLVNEGPLSSWFPPTLETIDVPPSVLSWCRIWVENLKKELETPDLWAAIEISSAYDQSRRRFWESPDDLPNDPLTDSEKRNIEENLATFQEQIDRVLELNDEQKKFLAAQIEYFRSASERLGKRDLKMILTGGLIQLVVGLALNPELARTFFNMAALFFQGLFAGPSPAPDLLPPSTPV